MLVPARWRVLGIALTSTARDGPLLAVAARDTGLEA